MKINSIHYIIRATLLVILTAIWNTNIVAEGIRIIPKSYTVRNDSLYLLLDMDLNSVHVNSLTAVSFIPILQAANKQAGKIELPPVIVTGSKRFRFEQRERALAVGQIPVIPYRILLDKQQTGSKSIAYRIAIPYASWMQKASLLLRQEVKDCCDQQVLGIDTLTKNLNLKQALQNNNIAANPVPAHDAGTQEHRSVVAPKKNNHTVSAAVIPRQAQKQVRVQTEALDYASMVSFLRPDFKQENKERIQSTTLYIDYPLGKDEVYPDFKNNREEINKIDAILYPLLSDGFSELEHIRIRGYTSPDGPYGENEKLSANRSRLFADYVEDAYKIPSRLFNVSSVAEDWSGLKELLRNAAPSYAPAALKIIDQYGIFSGREKQLMDLQGGIPYKDMLRRFFPKLRRIEIVVEYRIRKLNESEIAEMIYPHPDLMSLEEIYAVARYYRPGADQYREVYEIAAFHFPDDVIANVNAASAVMLTGDLESAWNYLRKAEADPRSWNNMGVLTLMEGDPEGAAVWFRKAVGVEPRKARQNLEIAESY
ncbi:MAG: DUF3868 domain-containing protein [Parabacteroides sp.]|nr:DUF3868 domain-containing protein [Parabacteroides sp.]